MSQNTRTFDYVTLFSEKNKLFCCFFLKTKSLSPLLLFATMSQPTGNPSCCFCKRARQKLYNIPVGYKGPVFPSTGWKNVQMCCRSCTDFAKAHLQVSPLLPPLPPPDQSKFFCFTIDLISFCFVSHLLRCVTGRGAVAKRRT